MVLGCFPGFADAPWNKHYYSDLATTVLRRINLNYTGAIIALKLSYLLLSLGLLWGIVWMAPKPGGGRFLDKRFRMIMIFRTVNVISIIGFVFFELRRPLWLGLAQTRKLFSSYFLGDLVNFTFLIWYFIVMLYLAYLMDRKTKGISPGFGSYLMQYGYFWLFVINILIVARLDYYYLPLIPESWPSKYRWFLELGSLVLLIGLQLLALLARSLKMVPAGPEVERLVRTVAGEFKVKVKKVRIWQLERVLNAFATGIFRKNIYLTETLVNSLELADLRMIVGHECAHFKKRHLELRIVMVLGLIFLGSSLIEDLPDLPWLIHGLYWGAAILVYNLFARFQEFEADRLAALKLGGGERMARALTRIAAPISFGRVFKWLVGHPDLEARLKRLVKVS